MDPLQLNLFYEVVSSAELWKYLVTTEMSHYSARIALLYLFLFSCCHQGPWGFYSNRDPLPSETSGFELPSVALGKAKHSGDLILSYWSSFLKILQWHHFCGQILAPWLAWLWAGWQQELQHLFFPVLSVTRMDFQACPRLGNLLHPSEAVGSERMCQNPDWWAHGFIYCSLHTWILCHLENPNENSQAVLLLWPALQKEQLTCSALLIFLSDHCPFLPNYKVRGDFFSWE